METRNPFRGLPGIRFPRPGRGRTILPAALCAAAICIASAASAQSGPAGEVAQPADSSSPAVPSAPAQPATAGPAATPVPAAAPAPPATPIAPAAPAAPVPPAAPAPAAVKPPFPEFDRRTPEVIAVERSGPGVVNISAERIVVMEREPFPGFQDLFFEPLVIRERVRVPSLGSGVIIDSDGYIVTNHHLVVNARNIRVTLKDKREYRAELVNFDVDNDLAVLQIRPEDRILEAEGAAPVEAEKAFPTVELGISSDLMVGERVIAIGNPYGYEHTVTTGVVSALNRPIVLKGREVFRDFIQTDAAINQGNSGGALLNINGRLIGINSAIRAEAVGIGFAIPVDRVKHILEEVLYHPLDRGIYVGMSCQPSDEDPERMIATDVKDGGPAAKAGIVNGDFIRRVGDAQVRSLLDFRRALIHHLPGETVVFDTERSGEPRPIKMEIAAPPRLSGAEVLRQYFGLDVETVDREFARRMQLLPSAGLYVKSVADGSPAKEGGMEPGDVIFGFDEEPIVDFETAGRALRGIRNGTRIVFSFFRGSFRGRTVLVARAK